MRNEKSLLSDLSGAAAVEYGLMIAAFAGAILFVIFVFGNRFNSARENVARQGAMGGGSADGGAFIHTSQDAR